MRLTTRIAKLERELQPGKYCRPDECPNCSQIDKKTKSGPWTPGITIVCIPDLDGPFAGEKGRWWCCCRQCRQTFTAKRARAADGTEYVLDVRPTNGPYFPGLFPELYR